MYMLKFSVPLTVVSLVAGTAIGQALPADGLQQPDTLTPAQPVQATVATEVQYPWTHYATTSQPAPLIGSIQQPDTISGSASFANFSDEEESEDVNEAVEDAADDSDCGCCDDGCDNGCEWGGFIQQGITFNGYDPRNRFNGPILMNDRANEYQLNQLWLYAERAVDNGGCGWDYGGRADVVYGTDARFMKMDDGLEENWDQDGYYQLALLRFYGDLAYNDWTLRAGRWDVPVGYEPFEGTESFFYSRSYNFLAQPGTMLALMLTRHLNDQLSLSAGMHRGTDQFDDRDGKDALDFVGGGSWESLDGETWLDAYVIAEEKGIGNDSLHYSIMSGTALSECWDYVAEWYYGSSDDAQAQAEWYGLNQHLIREINECWAYGMRFEWFRDDDGFRVQGFDQRNLAQGPFVGDFYEVTFAVNYTPRENFALRPEVRWDWYKSDGGGPEPFNDGTRSNQFIASIDAIWTF